MNSLLVLYFKCQPSCGGNLFPVYLFNSAFFLFYLCLSLVIVSFIFVCNTEDEGRCLRTYCWFYYTLFFVSTWNFVSCASLAAHFSTVSLHDSYSERWGQFLLWTRKSMEVIITPCENRPQHGIDNDYGDRIVEYLPHTLADVLTARFFFRYTFPLKIRMFFWRTMK